MMEIEGKVRKELEAKFATVLESKIEELPAELHQILLDDMVTAFENRLNVLNRTTTKADN
jgi:hypothetical protein